MSKGDLDDFARCRMHEYLIGLGIFPNVVCYYMLIECVIAAIKLGNIACCVSKIYHEAGIRTNRTATSVERGIRFSLKKCMYENRMKTINDYLGMTVYSNEYPLRNGEIISLFATKIAEDFGNVENTAKTENTEGA